MSLLRLFRLLFSKNRSFIFLSILLSVITIMSSTFLLALSAYIISFCALQPSIADVSVAVVGVRFFGIVRGIFRYLERLISHNTTFKMLSYLRVWIFERIEQMNIFTYSQMDKEDIFTRIIDDVETLQEFYLRTFNPYVVSIVTGILGFILLFTFNCYIAIGFALLYILAIGAAPIFIWVFTNGLYKRQILQRSAQKAKFIDFISGITDILGNSALGTWIKDLELLMNNEVSTQRRIAQWKSFSNSLILLLTNGAMVVCLAIGAKMAGEGKLSKVYLAVVVLAASSLFEAAQLIPSMFQRLEQSKAAGDRIFELDSKSTEIKSVKNNEISFSTNNYCLRVENIVYRYPMQDMPVINNVSFELALGRRVAIVGASGSGKSTLIYLLLKWLECEAGTIKLNGVPIRELSGEYITNLFSVVNQQVYFFNTTIGNNLKIGNSTTSGANIEKALTAAVILETIKSFPEGFDTEIGDGGMRLSGGERQRLAIARALLKESPFIILDEPTAGLDMATERKVLDGLYENTKDRGLLLITHRLVGLENMDEILVIDKGAVVERGTEEKLISNKGLYYKMWSLQQEFIQ